MRLFVRVENDDAECIGIVIIDEQDAQGMVPVKVSRRDGAHESAFFAPRSRDWLVWLKEALRVVR